MRTMGLAGAAALVVTLFATDGWAQKPTFGPEYERAVCGCRVTAAKAPAQWPACMKRRGYTVAADPGFFIVCPGKKKK